MPTDCREGERQQPLVLGGKRGYPDVEYEESAVLVHLDGRIGHSDSLDKWADLDARPRRAGGRVTASGSAGHRCSDPCRLAASMAAVLQQRGWAGRPSALRSDVHRISAPEVSRCGANRLTARAGRRQIGLHRNMSVTAPNCGAVVAASRSQPAVALGGDAPPRRGWWRRSCRSRTERWLRTVPSERNSFLAIAATDEPSRAARSTSVSRGVSGDSPATRLVGGQGRVDHAQPGVHAAYGVGELGRGGVLDDEPGRRRPAARGAGSRAGRRWSRSAPGSSGDGRADLGGRGDAVEAGHLDVEQGDVGPVLEHGREHGVAGADLGDDLEVGLEAEQRGQRAADQGLVVGEQQPDASCAAPR